MLTILMDVDDVCADLVSAWLRKYNKEYNDSLTRDQIEDWDIIKYVKPEAKDKFLDLINNQRFYWDVVPVDGALEGIKTLRDAGHRIIFATNAFVGHAGAKLKWLQHYGFLEAGKMSDPDYVEISDKSLILADVIVDDRQKNIIGFVKTGGCAVIFNAPWNKDVVSDDACIFRASNWNEVVTAITIIDQQGKPETIKENVDRGFSVPIEQLDRISQKGTAKLSENDHLSTGFKFDADKDRWDLLPWEASREIVKVMTLGAKKYAPYNWAKGMSWSRVYSALLRHLTAWFLGENLDKETGLSHLAHAGCCLLFLLSYQIWGGYFNELDDRPTTKAIDSLRSR